MNKNRNKLFSRKPLLDYGLKFSSASLGGTIITTMLAFLVVWFLNKGRDISLNSLYTLRILIVALFFGALIAFVLNRIFVHPLVKLADAMKKVAGGDFSLEVKCPSKFRYIKDVYSAFNMMVRELAKTETLQTDFVSNVSHEFKTPINAIEGYASLLQDKQLSPAEQNIYVEKIMFNTRKLSELVGNILLLSKVTNQSMQIKATSFRLDEQIRQSILALESKWEEKEIEFDIELEDIVCTGYENLLSHVWLNLIDNAIKFDPQGGTIRISLSRSGDDAVFSIWNNGPEISPADTERIFTKFYQAESSRASEGNGLGLALVKNIVDSSGGTIGVSSSAGNGTEFTVTLPLNIGSC